jgi:hypothetical protein
MQIKSDVHHSVFTTRYKIYITTNIIEALAKRVFGFFTDVWTVGLISIILLTGKQSVWWFNDASMIIQNIKDDVHLGLIPKTISQAFQKTIRSCLHK